MWQCRLRATKDQFIGAQLFIFCVTAQRHLESGWRIEEGVILRFTSQVWKSKLLNLLQVCHVTVTGVWSNSDAARVSEDEVTCVCRNSRWVVASQGVRQIWETEFLQLQKKNKDIGENKRLGNTKDLFLCFVCVTRNARHCCKQLKDTIPSWKKDFVANHFCHNAAHSPNIHYICAA